MKIALPLTSSDQFSPHYGAATRFVVFDVDPTYRTVRRRVVMDPQASEPGEWPRFLRAAGVDLILAGGMAEGARQHAADLGMRVMAGVPSAAPEDLVSAWLEGRLTTAAQRGESVVAPVGSS